MKKKTLAVIFLSIPFLSNAQFSSNGNDLYHFGGNVGIGTTNPSARLHLLSDEKNLALFYGSNSSGLLSDRFNRLVIRNLNGQQSWIGIEGSGANAIGYLGIEHWQAASPSVSLSWNKDGEVGIGTTDPESGSKLTVAGKISTREVKVTVDAGADHVFEEDYHLPDLARLETFIKENKHLPEIAPEKEMLEKGIEVGEFQIKLLQKIEELTLYIIDQQKEIKALKNELITSECNK